MDLGPISAPGTFSRPDKTHPITCRLSILKYSTRNGPRRKGLWDGKGREEEAIFYLLEQVVCPEESEQMTSGCPGSSPKAGLNWEEDEWRDSSRPADIIISPTMIIITFS